MENNKTTNDYLMNSILEAPTPPQFFEKVFNNDEYIGSFLLSGPTQPLMLGHCKDINPVVEKVLLMNLFPIGVIGPKEEVLSFLKEFSQAKQNINSIFIAGMREFRCEKLLKEPQRSILNAEREDIETICEFISAYRLEAHAKETQPLPSEVLKKAEKQINDRKTFVIKEKNIVVAMASIGRLTKNEGWVFDVFTPVEFRGRGYASDLVAFLASKILDLGKTPMLFTDLKNETSNKIYQEIGFTPIEDFLHYSFIYEDVKNKQTVKNFS